MADDEGRRTIQMRSVGGGTGGGGSNWGTTGSPAAFLQHPFFRRVLFPALVLLAGINLLLSVSFTYVRPNQVGVKVVRVPLLSKRGVHEEAYGPGFHFVLKLFSCEELYLFPHDVQVFDMTGAREEAAREARISQPAHIQTSDGFFVDADVTILYRIHDAYKAFTRLGGGRLFESNGIEPRAEPILKQALGELSTEDFYDARARSEKAQLAQAILNRELTEFGMQVDHVLVRYFRYSDEIQRNIEERKLKDQLVFKNQAEARAATEGAALKKMSQEGEASVRIKLQEGAAYITTKDAERDLYVRKKQAEADLLTKLAEAKKTQLRNEAYQGNGSERMVGLKMAEVYKGIEVLVLPSDGAAGVNPLDLQRTLKLFDLSTTGGKP
jgi:regulator of protease activity HflC (stomatin/prohibitin superfamily)